MPRGPKGEKRSADVIGAAVMIGKIATGEIDDLTTDDGKNAAAGAHGRKGASRRYVCKEAERDRAESGGQALVKIVLNPFQIRSGIWKISWR